MGTVVRGATPVGERRATALLDTRHPLVAGRATNAIPLAQLGHRVEFRTDVGDEAFPLFISWRRCHNIQRSCITVDAMRAFCAARIPSVQHTTWIHKALYHNALGEKLALRIDASFARLHRAAARYAKCVAEPIADEGLVDLERHPRRNLPIEDLHMFSAIKKLGIVAALVAVTGTTVQAQVFNTGGGVGPTDPFWSLTYNMFGLQAAGGTYGPTSGAFANANVITTIPSPPWNPNNGPLFRWIGVSATGTVPITSGTPAGDGTMRFDYVFSTTVLGTGDITGALGWDNQLLGYNFGTILTTAEIATLSGMSFFSPPGNFDQYGFCRDGDGEFPSIAFPNCTQPFDIGSHTAGDRLNIYLRGDGQTDGIILNQATPPSSVVPEPSTYALMATGLVSMMGFARRRRRAV